MTIGILFTRSHGSPASFRRTARAAAPRVSLVLCALIRNLTGFDIPVGTMAFAVNGILLLAAGFVIGWKFGLKTIFCVVMLSISLNFFQAELPAIKEWLTVRGLIAPDAISIFGNLEPILLVIMGGLLSGVGIYICFMQGGSTGGVDILALIINKYHPINYGRVVIVHDATVILASLLVGNGPETVIYGFPAHDRLQRDHRCAALGQPAVEPAAHHQPPFPRAHRRGDHPAGAPRRDAAQRHGLVCQGAVAGGDGHLPQTRNAGRAEDREERRSGAFVSVTSATGFTGRASE